MPMPMPPQLGSYDMTMDNLHAMSLNPCARCFYDYEETQVIYIIILWTVHKEELGDTCN